MKTRDIRYAGRTVALPDLPVYGKFYGKLERGEWEPRTFEVLARNLDAETVYIDIGAWIGVTPFWAAGLVKKVVAVEPDPECRRVLRELLPAYGNVVLMEGALSSKADVTLHAVDGFGSSETSVLEIGEGETVQVRGFDMDEILRQAGEVQVFVKIDIEGYEFAMAGEIAKLRRREVKGLQLAVHPRLLGTGIGRRLRMAWEVWKLGRLFGGFFLGPQIPKYRGLMHYILSGIVFRAEPKGADFLFERDLRVSNS